MQSSKPATDATPNAAPVAAVAAPVAKKPAAKPAPKAPATKPTNKPVSKPAAKAITKPAAKPTAKAAAKPASKPVQKAATNVAPKATASKAAVAKPAKEKKIKMVRDSISIPKTEYLVLDAMKLRAAKLTVPVKKTELIRAGIKALAVLGDAAFLAALGAVPSLKTGRPAKSA